MEDKNFSQSTTNDDEVLLKQKDGSFRLVKVSELNALNVKKVETQNFASLQKFVPSIQLYDQAAEELIRKSGLVVAPELSQRFKIIIISRLKDVRKLPETRERLLASPAVGGVGLKAEEAERIIKMLEEERNKIPNLKSSILRSSATAEDGQIPNKSQISNLKIETPPPPPPPAPSVSPKPAVPQPPVAASPQIPQGKVSLGQARKLQADIPAQVTGYRLRVTGTSSDIKPAAPSVLKIVPQEKTQPKMEVAPAPPPPAKPPITVAIPETPAGRAKVEDVAYKPRLVGPLEELREMTLLDFRRLSPQAKVTIDKIYAKIELLAEQGYEKRIQGIKAWQASPVNTIYLEILNESLGKALPVAQIIADRQKASRETLSPEEFKAVMELNRKLRY